MSLSSARILYVLGYLLTKEELYIRAEGLINSAESILEKKNCYENINLRIFYVI